MEQKDKYKLSIYKRQGKAVVDIIFGMLIISILFVIFPIIQNGIQIDQIFDILAKKFPEQELYSIVDYIKHLDKLNKTLYIILGVIYIALIVRACVFIHKGIAKYLLDVEILWNKILQLEASHPLTLPQILDNARAQKYLKKAIDAGLIKTTSDGLRRVTKICNKTQLAYLLKCIYCSNPTDKFPDYELNSLFGEQRLGAIVYKLTSNANGKPRLSKVIDDLFEE